MENALVVSVAEGTRMGNCIKALLPFGDTCLIEYLVQSTQPYFSRIYLCKNKGTYPIWKLPETETRISIESGTNVRYFSGLSMIDEECSIFYVQSTLSGTENRTWP